MKVIRLTYLIFIMAVSVIGCTTARSQTQSTGKGNGYEEDLAAFRPKYTNGGSDTVPAAKKNQDQPPVTPQKDITRDLNLRMDTLAIKNSHVRNAQGYRVLVYSGKSSDEVKKAKDKVYDLIPDADIMVAFKSPNQIIKVGNCIDRLEAYNLLTTLKKAFPTAVIVPDQIIIKGK